MMDPIEILEESMKVLDVMSEFINKESINYIRCEEIRDHIEKAFQEIYDIYQRHGDDSLEEELRDRWEESDAED